MTANPNKASAVISILFLCSGDSYLRRCSIMRRDKADSVALSVRASRVSRAKQNDRRWLPLLARARGLLASEVIGPTVRT